MTSSDSVYHEGQGGSSARTAAAFPASAKPSGAKRLFLAFWPEADLVKRLTQILGTIPVPSFGTAAVPERNYHVTLHFLGAVAGESQRALVAALARAAGVWKPFELESTVIAYLPSAAQPHSLVLDMQAIPRMGGVEVHRGCADLLRGIPLPVEARPWRPHITLARIRSTTVRHESKRQSEDADSRSGVPRQSGPGVQTAAAWPWVPVLRMPVRSLHLVESILESRGARYDILESFGLGI